MRLKFQKQMRPALTQNLLVLKNKCVRKKQILLCHSNVQQAQAEN